MATKIGDTVSRIRNVVKGVKEDAFLTDRFLYSLVLKYAKMVIRRQDNENKIMRMRGFFETLPCIELMEVDKVEACCTGIKTNCTIMRTKDKLPDVLNGLIGPLFRDITSIDGSIVAYPTYASQYVSMTNSTSFKYNKTVYYWFRDGYLYFPNIEWEAVSVEALWEDSINYLKCDSETCAPRQDDPTPIPDYLFAEIEQMVLKDLLVTIQTPVEGQDDKQSPLRT